MSDCLFCKIAAKEIPSDCVYEDDSLVAFRDIAPAAPTHILIIPRKHIATINDVEPEDAELTGKMILLAKRLAAEDGGDADAIKADRPVVRVGSINFDPPGPDANVLDAESVTFENEGYGRVDFTGWVLRDESGTNRFTFPRGSLLESGGKLTVVTGCNAGGDATVTWCADAPVWSNGGDTVIVSDSLGNAVIWFTYTGDGT